MVDCDLLRSKLSHPTQGHQDPEMGLSKTNHKSKSMKLTLKYIIHNTSIMVFEFASNMFAYWLATMGWNFFPLFHLEVFSYHNELHICIHIVGCI